MAHTAIDFAARLVRMGALRVAFANELRSTAVAAATRDNGCGPAWGWVDLLSSPESRHLDSNVAMRVVQSSARRTQCGQHHSKGSNSQVTLCRSLSDGPSRNSSGGGIGGLPRTQSTPASLPSYCGRCRGTLLRLQDEAQPYCCVSVASEVTVIPVVIEERFHADYWRFVAGGEHSIETLEQRARAAATAYFSQHT